MSFGTKAECDRLREKLLLKNSAVKRAIDYLDKSPKHTASCMCNLCQVCRLLKIALTI
jgi:hypothetical protein